MIFAPTESFRVIDELQTLYELKSVTETLQRPTLTFLESEILLNSVIVAFPLFPFNSYLSIESNIVSNPDFESAIIKIQDGRELDMSVEEREAVNGLMKSASVLEEDENGLSLAQKALKRSAQKNELLQNHAVGHRPLDGGFL